MIKKGVCKMFRNGWLLFLVLLCVAFLVSCGKNKTMQYEKGELVRYKIQFEIEEYKRQSC